MASVNTDTNVLMTAWRTQANITDELSSIATKWSISAKIIACVHDGISNMKDSGRTNNWADVGCSTHKLHLSVTAVLRIDKISNKPIKNVLMLPHN